MITDNNYLAVITARAGSKGIPNKNIIDVNGEPLLVHTFKAVQGIDNVLPILSTDSKQMAEIAEEHNISVPFMRPEELSTDMAPSVDVIRHAIDYYKERDILFRAVITLQPTSPLRTKSHIKESIKLFEEHDSESLVSVYQSTDFNYTQVYRASGVSGQCLSDTHTRRQDLDNTYIRNGAIYITTLDYLLSQNRIFSNNPLLYVMSKQDSLDLNTLDDLENLRNLLGN